METEKKKLLLIATSLKQGGFQRVCARTAILLSQYYKVSVVVFDGREIAYLLNDIPIYNLEIEAQTGILKKIVNVFRRIRKIKDIKRKNQIDISYSFGMSANLINILTRVNDVIWSGIRSFVDLDTKSIGLVCRKSDIVICCSKDLENRLSEKYQVKKITTIYNPFDIDELTEESKDDIEDKDFFLKSGKLIVAMGREDNLKGYWHLIKCFAAIEDKNTRLCIIGKGMFEKEKSLVEELKISERVYFTGGKQNPFCYLKYADIYVMSSIHEGFPNALVEAMALQLPVISTNCETGPREILLAQYESNHITDKMIEADYGILVPALPSAPDYTVTTLSKEENILTEAIEFMLQNDKLRERYALTAKERAAHFGTQKYVECFLQLTK